MRAVEEEEEEEEEVCKTKPGITKQSRAWGFTHRPPTHTHTPPPPPKSSLLAARTEPPSTALPRT